MIASRCERCSVWRESQPVNAILLCMRSNLECRAGGVRVQHNGAITVANGSRFFVRRNRDRLGVGLSLMRKKVWWIVATEVPEDDSEII